MQYSSNLAMRARAWIVASVFALVAVSGAQKMDVNIAGVKVGEMNVTGYAAGFAGRQATAGITGNFTKTGIEAGGQALLEQNAPCGLTYMQTVRFMTNQQQRIFRDAMGNNLVGTFADPPQMGYTLRDGSRAFATDNTPWYSTIAPSGTAGDIPPTYAGFGGNQFQDSVAIGVDPSNGIDGLFGALNEMDGSVCFETCLVGVKQKPDAGMEKTGQYKVSVLKCFTWGMNFTWNATNRTYSIAAKPLTYSTTASADFTGAFDQMGDNSGVEWNVMFMDPVPEPSSMAAMSLALVGLIVARRKRVRS